MALLLANGARKCPSSSSPSFLGGREAKCCHLVRVSHKAGQNRRIHGESYRLTPHRLQSIRFFEIFKFPARTSFGVLVLFLFSAAQLGGLILG